MQPFVHLSDICLISTELLTGFQGCFDSYAIYKAPKVTDNVKKLYFP